MLGTETCVVYPIHFIGSLTLKACVSLINLLASISVLSLPGNTNQIPIKLYFFTIFHIKFARTDSIQVAECMSKLNILHNMHLFHSLLYRLKDTQLSICLKINLRPWLTTTLCGQLFFINDLLSGTLFLCTCIVALWTYKKRSRD